MTIAKLRATARRTREMNHRLPKPLLILAFVVLAAGLLLRTASFYWNNRLQGDVNLFALTAREYVNHNNLYYPMKFEYSDNVEYKVLKSPASQHPPLWPFLAGLFGKLFRTDDTFPILKAMCEVVGLLLVVIVGYTGMLIGDFKAAMIATACTILSPMLVDFSANGSSYILVAAMIVLAIILLERFHYQGMTDYVLAGVLCGLALQIHSVMICLPISFCVLWLCERSRLRWKGVLAFSCSALLLLSPWIFWNFSHFGKPFYSYSTYYFLEQLDLAQEGIYGDAITTRLTGTISLATIKLYASLILSNVRAFSLVYLLEVGPFCLSLAVVGLFALSRTSRRQALAFSLPPMIYTVIVLLWGSFKYRFFAPILPVSYLAAGIGVTSFFAELRHRRFTWKLVGIVCLVGTIVWGIPYFLEKPPTRYYYKDRGHAAYYSQMLPLANQLGQLREDVVLGYSISLDGGFETVYWHRFPFVYARDFDQRQILKLVRDFDIRYIWADEYTVDQIRAIIPNAKTILYNDTYYVLDMPD